MLAWDSAHFSRRIARVRGRLLTRESLARIDDWAARRRVDCLYFLADPGDPPTAPLAEAAGFRLVDVRVTLERTAAGATPTSHPAPGAAAVRPAVPADLAELRRIAAASHRDSRFYADPHFPRERCDELYAAWIAGSCDDPAGSVLVAVEAASGSVPVGYITAALEPDGGGRIGLFAVGESARGRGVGSRLIGAALDWFAERGAGPVRVVTQGRNVRAQHLYQRAGLLTSAVELWFHRWHAGDAGDAGDAGAKGDGDDSTAWS